MMIRSNFDLLLDDLAAAGARRVDGTSAAGKAARARSTLAKSVPATSLKDFFAKAQAAGGKVTIRETAKVGDKVLVKGKKAEKIAAGSHPGLHLEGLRQDLQQHVESQEVSPEDLRGPLSEPLLRRLLADAKSGKIHLNAEDLENLDKAFRARNAIPMYLIKRLSGQ
ncbi:hypothetical protein OKW41_006143 [Paraburkholderia sp. UCT70]|uniref:hypothetical protein n=1 Tax=Paraburkholderia sp. UCT70 TaxID=2991068 RepID=UPI003D1DFE06